MSPSPAAPQAVGFIGLGAMGYLMAKNLREKIGKDTTLVVYDVNRPSIDRFVQENESAGSIEVGKNAWDVVKRTDIIITIVPEGKHVLQVFSSDNNGALSGDVSGKIFIESSTIDIETSRTVADHVKSKSGIFVDCPVSGGTSGAAAGTITFMIGAKEGEKTYSDIHAVLATMGKNLIACGGPTLGLASKLSNNYVSGTIAIATSEGMNMAMRLGLDPKVFSKVLSVSTGASWVNSHCNPVPGVVAKAPASNNYDPGFKIELMKKDYDLALKAAASVNAKIVLGAVGIKTYDEAIADPRCAGRDCRVVYRYLGGKE